MQFVLEVSNGVRAGEKTWLRHGQALRVGRTEKADFVIAHDDQISGAHFQVALEGGACMLRDLASRNGTFLNGQRITESEIHDGDEIRAGQTTFAVQINNLSREGESTAVAPLLEKAGSADARTDSEVSRAAPFAAGSASAPPDAPQQPSAAAPPLAALEKRAPTLILEAIVGPGAGGKREISAGQTLRVGRSEPADYRFPGDVQMSRVHFSLQSGDQPVIRDLNSSNGTYVNGNRIERSIVNTGDHIVAGLSTFRVSVQPAAAQRETPASSAATVAEFSPAPHEPEGETPVLQVTNHTPFEVSLMVWEDGEERLHLTVIVKATFAIENQKRASLAPEQLPVFEADEPYRDEPGSSLRYESDLVPLKPRADVVVVGKAHAPRGAPVTELDVTVRVGSLARTMRVFGDRKWSFPTLMADPRFSAPEPFVTMDLLYERAFGGIDAAAARYCQENLAGTGFIGKLSSDSMHGKPLPNLEDPEHLISAWDTHPKPVGFGFYGRGWMPRIKHLGTYDEEYRKTRSPRPPADFSNAFYNAAHPDLQVDGYLRGDEVVELKNLSPISDLRFQLPGWRPKVTVTRSSIPATTSAGGAAGRDSPRLTEERLRGALDTLVLIPDENKGYLVSRAVCDLSGGDELKISRIEVV